MGHFHVIDENINADYGIIEAPNARSALDAVLRPAGWDGYDDFMAGLDKLARAQGFDSYKDFAAAMPDHPGIRGFTVREVGSLRKAA